MREGTLFRFTNTGVVIEYKGNGRYDVLGSVGECGFMGDPNAEKIYEPMNELAGLGWGSIITSAGGSIVAVKQIDKQWLVSGFEGRMSDDAVLSFVGSDYSVAIRKEK